MSTIDLTKEINTCEWAGFLPHKPFDCRKKLACVGKTMRVACNIPRCGLQSSRRQRARHQGNLTTTKIATEVAS